MKTGGRLIWLLAVGASAVVLVAFAGGCSSSGDSEDNESTPPALITPTHSSLEIYSAIGDVDECVGGGESLFAPAWDEEEQVWAAPCANDDASKSRCLLVQDDTLEIESKDLEGSSCRQGP